MNRQAPKRTTPTLLAAATGAALLLAGCADLGPQESAAASQDDPLVLTLAHSLGEGHPTTVAVEEFADAVHEESQGRIRVEIFANGVLGSETQVIEQVMAGVLDMTRVASPGLGAYEDGYHTFGLPYIFEDEEHFYAAMDSGQMREFFASTREEGFVGLTYYTSGARSFYTRGTEVREPDDLAGLKIRIQDFRTQTQLMNVLGGTPVVMAFGDTYTALQTGIIDGAESNETALTESSHGEVTSVFSRTEHTIIPDMLVVSTESWDRLDEADQELVTRAAITSTEDHRTAWEEAIDEAVAGAEEMGVTFVDDVDRDAFREATAPLVEEYADGHPRVAEILSIIDGAR